jgi:hypothetical protein
LLDSFLWDSWIFEDPFLKISAKSTGICIVIIIVAKSRIIGEKLDRPKKIWGLIFLVG